MMKAVVLAIFLCCACFAQAPRIYIEPDSQGGFDSYLSAAMIKKHVPAVVTRNAEEASYILSNKVIAKEASATTKVLGCLLAYCAGAAGTQTATVQLIDAKTHEVVWAYNVQKASAAAWQSTSEAVAKHLKEFLEKNPR
jgi:hypothetical protein